VLMNYFKHIDDEGKHVYLCGERALTCAQAEPRRAALHPLSPRPHEQLGLSFLALSPSVTLHRSASTAS
jgi:hypothetical protein